MSALPATFKADLRYPVGYKNINENRWFQWSSLPMIELSVLDTYHFVKGMITRPAQKILEIGCGNGYLSLELARDGHDVTGIDLSQDIIAVAERTKAEHPDMPGFEKLTYMCTDFAQWQAADGSFDTVIFNRTLHHLIDLQPAVGKVKRLLNFRNKLLGIEREAIGGEMEAA